MTLTLAVRKTLHRRGCGKLAHFWHIRFCTRDLIKAEASKCIDEFAGVEDGSWNQASQAFAPRRVDIAVSARQCDYNLRTPHSRRPPLFELVITLLLAAHLLCVNVASAGPLVGMWLEWREGRGDGLAGQTASYLGRACWWSLLAGGLLGLAVGLLSWTAEYAALWSGPMHHKATWAIAEYFFSLALAAGYLLWRSRAATQLRGLRIFVLFLAGSNLLYHFPFLFTVANDLFVQDQLAIAQQVSPLSASEFRLQMARPDVLARVVHVVLASFAVTGIVLLGYCLRLQRQGTAQGDAQRVARWGGWLALIPSLIQVPVGLWLIAVLPPAWQARALGDDLLALGLLGTSVLLALFLLQELSTLAFGEMERKHAVRAMVSMVLVVFLMTSVLRRIRPTLPETARPPITAELSMMIVQ